MPSAHLWIRKSTPAHSGPASESSETRKRPSLPKIPLSHLLVTESCYQRTKAGSSSNQSTGWEHRPCGRECPVTYHSPCCRTFWKVSFARRGWGDGWRENSEDFLGRLQPPSPSPCTFLIPPPNHSGSRKIGVTRTLVFVNHLSQDPLPPLPFLPSLSHRLYHSLPLFPCLLFLACRFQ